MSNAASRGPRRIAWLLFGLALCLGAAFPYFGSFMNANERPRILQAIAWVDTGDLAVDGPGARGIDPGIDVARSPVDGRLYPNKPPGASIAAAVAYAGVRVRGGPIALRDVTRAARLVGGLLPTLILAGFMLHRFARRRDPTLAAAAVVLWALATPVASYARLLFGHQLTACLLGIGTALVVDASDPSASRRPLLAFAGGLFAASAIAVEYTAAFAGLPIGVFLILRFREDRRVDLLASAIAGALVPVALLCLYHAVVFGGPFTTPYHHVVDPDFARIHGRGLLGLGVPTWNATVEHLFSPWGGLFYWAPLFALAFAYAASRWRELDRETRLGLAIFGVLLVVNLGLLQTGGWRVGPRYLVAALPLLVPALVLLLEHARDRFPLATIVLALAVWSTAVNGLASHLFPHLVPAGNPLADLLVPLLLAGNAPYDVLAPIVGGERPALVLLLALGMAMVLGSLWLAFSRGTTRTRAFAVGSVAAVLGLLAALALPSAPDADSTLDAVQRIWEPRPDGAQLTIEIGPIPL